MSILPFSWPRAILHVDGDAFFASCEQAMHPEWKGRAVITGAERGIVSAASYEAKAKGVARGTPLWEVKKIIPDAIVVASDYESYSLFSKRMFEVMRRFTSLVEEYSIDEAFADITGMRRPLHGSYEDIARRMQAAIAAELGITVSVGVSVSKVLAKIASKHRKPSGLTAIPGRAIDGFLRGFPVGKVWGIGPRTAAYCNQLGVRDAFDFATRSEEWVSRHFTKPHHELWAELRGQSVWPVSDAEPSPQHTIGKTRTFTPPSTDREFVFAQLLKNVENACIKARRHHLIARGIVVYLKRQDYSYAGTEATFSRSTAYPVEIVSLVRAAFDELYRPRTPYRATGVTLLGLGPDDTVQASLFDAPLRIERMRKLYTAVDALAGKFGKHAVHLAGSAAAHQRPQHANERKDLPARKLGRLRGEGERKHLRIPLLMTKLT